MASQTGQGSIYAAVALSIYFAFGRYIMSGLYIAVVLENFELSDDYIRHYQIKDFINRHRFKDRGRTETILYELFRPLYKVHDKKSIQVASLPAHLSLPLSTADITELLSGVPFRRRIDQVTKPSIIEKKILQLAAKIRKKLPFFKKKISIKDEPM
jgi:hypothetical protein